MFNRKVGKNREGYPGNSMAPQKHNSQNNSHRMSAGSYKDGHKQVHKSGENSGKQQQHQQQRNNDRRSAVYNKHGAAQKSSEREAKHLKTAIRRCGNWTEHVSSSGKHYYFDIKSSASQWEKPKDWSDSAAVDMKRKSSVSSSSSNNAAVSSKTPAKTRSDSTTGGKQAVAASASANTTPARSNSRVPSYDGSATSSSSATTTTNNNSGGSNGNDKDFRSPRHMKEHGDRDYRTKIMPGGTPIRDRDFRKRRPVSGSRLSRGDVDLRDRKRSVDKDYRSLLAAAAAAQQQQHQQQHTNNTPRQLHDATVTGSNGQPLSHHNHDSNHHDDSDKPETGQFYDYSNWNVAGGGGRKSVDLVNKTSYVRRKLSPELVADKDNNGGGSGYQMTSSPREGGMSDVARTLSSVLATAVNNNNNKHTNNNSNPASAATGSSAAAAASSNGIENALKLVLNAAMASKQIDQDNIEEINNTSASMMLDDSMGSMGSSKRARKSMSMSLDSSDEHHHHHHHLSSSSTVLAAANTPLHDEQHGSGGGVTMVDASLIFTTYHTGRNLVNPDLMNHLLAWPTTHHEREANRCYSDEAKFAMSLENINFELAQARAKVRQCEISRMVYEQRLHFLRQEMKEQGLIAAATSTATQQQHHHMMSSVVFAPTEAVTAQPPPPLQQQQHFNPLPPMLQQKPEHLILAQQNSDSLVTTARIP